MPMHEYEWKAVADQFEERWNYPNCIVTIDGKHIALKRPLLIQIRTILITRILQCSLISIS